MWRTARMQQRRNTAERHCPGVPCVELRGGRLPFSSNGLFMKRVTAHLSLKDRLSNLGTDPSMLLVCSFQDATKPQPRGTGCVHFTRPNQWGASSGLRVGRPYPGSNSSLILVTETRFGDLGAAMGKCDTITLGRRSRSTSCAKDRAELAHGIALNWGDSEFQVELPVILFIFAP